MELRNLAFSLKILIAAAVVTMAGCATQEYPPAPTAIPGSGGYSYKIGPGDTLNVIVWRNPELSGSVPVRPDGKISTALVEDVPAQGKDASALARDIEKALGKFIRDPIVTVEVTTFTGPYDQQVRVVGEVQKPQTLPYRQDMTLLDVMIAVGGVTDFADGNAATILRTGDGNKQYRVRIRDLVKRGDVSANVPMQPGDVIFIPQSWF